MKLPSIYCAQMRVIYDAQCCFCIVSTFVEFMWVRFNIFLKYIL